MIFSNLSAYVSVYTEEDEYFVVKSLTTQGILPLHNFNFATDEVEILVVLRKVASFFSTQGFCSSRHQVI